MAAPRVESPRVLIYDIETVQNIVASFRLWERGGMSLPHSSIIQEGYIVCGAWMWLGQRDSQVEAVSVLDDIRRYRKQPHDDRYVVETLHKLLSSADAIVHHNGKAFDLKTLNARIVYHGMQPLPPLRQMDTKLIAASQFRFNANNLDYLGKYLGVGRKIKTDGELWMRVLRGEQAAIREMVTYNKQDVVLLKNVFLKLRPYIPDHINRQLFGDIGCPRCGSLKTQARGTQRSVTRSYTRYQCQECGGWFRDVKAEGAGAKQRVL